MLLPWSLLTGRKDTNTTTARTSASKGRTGKQRRKAKDRLILETLEDRRLLSISPSTNFPGMNFNDSGGSTPPDTHAAAGPTEIVEVVNSTIAFYNKASGAATNMQSLTSFFAPVSAGANLFDPKVVYDEGSQRFAVISLDVDFAANQSFVNIAVSDDNTAAGAWEMHRYQNDQGGLYWGDYPGFGWDADAFYVTFNMFAFNGNTFDHVKVLTITKSSVTDNNNTTFQSFDVNPAIAGLFTMQPAIMHGAAAGNNMYFVSSGATGGTGISVIRMTNKLNANPTFTPTNIAVTAFNAAPPADQGGGGQVDSGDTRILSVSWRGNTLAAAHTVGTGGADHARWYLLSAPATGAVAPALAQQGEINPGAGIYTYYPAIDIAPNGDIGMTFMQSSNVPTSQFMSMYVTGRKTSDPLNTMQTPRLARAGAANYGDFSGFPPRTGDYGGITVDPGTNYFWAAHEYATNTAFNNWGTWIYRFAVDAAPYVVSSSPSGVVSPGQTFLDFNFSEDMNAATFSIAADVRSFTGPSGNLLPAITGFAFLTPTTLRVFFNNQVQNGVYQMVIGPDIRDLDQGNQMDQSQNGVAGQDPADRYTAQFIISTPGTIFVDATNPNVGDGSAGNPWKYLQDALKAAAANAAIDDIQVYGNLPDVNGDAVPYVWRKLGDENNDAQLDGDMVVGNALNQGDYVTFFAKTLLQLPAGTPAPLFVKMQDNIVDIGNNSQMRVLGVDGFEVVFTSFQDDEAGGDTNGDGTVSIPQRKDWGGIRFRGDAVDQGATAATGSLIDYGDIRYTGATLFDAVSGANIEFGSVRMEFSGFVGGVTPRVSQIRVQNTLFQHGGRALDVEMRALAGTGPEIRNITYVDNSINGLFVNIPFLPIIPNFTVDSVWDDVSTPYIVTQRLTVTGKLTVNPGMVVKVQRNEINVRTVGAELHVNGTVDLPVVFTSALDDQLPLPLQTLYSNGSADTNNDGSDTQGLPGQWGGVSVSEGNIDHAFFSFGGGLVPLGGSFVNRSPIAIQSNDLRPFGPLQNFRVANTDVTQTFTGNVDFTFYQSPAITATGNGQIAVMDNFIHDNQGRAIQTASSVYTTRMNDLGGYGIYLRRNIINGNGTNNGVWTDTINNTGYLDDTDIVQTINTQITAQGTNQVTQLQSHRAVVPTVTGFLDGGSGIGNGAGSEFQKYLAELNAQGVFQGPLPRNAALLDSGLYYYLVNFESTSRGTAVPGLSQIAAGNVRGEEWRDWGVDFATTAAGGLFPMKALAFNAGDPNPTTPVSGSNVITTGDANNGSFEMVFPNMVSAVGFWVVGNDVTSPNEHIDFFGDQNNLLESIPMPETGSGPVFVWRVSRMPIYRIGFVEDANDKVGSLFKSSGAAVNIPDNGSITSNIVVNTPSNFQINDINVLINITHNRAADLKVELVAPNNAAITLTQALGGTGANYTNTYFDDQATFPVTAGVAPFTGVFKPITALTAFNGLNVNGTWKLRVTDTATGITGQLKNWSITFGNATSAPELKPDIAGIDDLYYADAGQSLVVKMGNAAELNAGTFDGTDVNAFLNQNQAGYYRVGGTLRILGQSSYPVVITGLSDDEVGAGIVGHIQPDSNGNGPSLGQVGSWVGVNILNGANTSRIENIVQLANGTIVRTSSDLNPYTIGDEAGSDTDELYRGTGNIFVNLQDGVLIEHADIRFSQVAIDVQGYPDGKLQLESNEVEPGQAVTVTDNRPFAQVLQSTYETYNGAVRVGGNLGNLELDIYRLSSHLDSPPLNTYDIIHFDVDHTSNDTANGGLVNIWVYNAVGQLVYCNGPAVGGTANYIGGMIEYDDETPYETTAPFWDAEYVVITDPDLVPACLVPSTVTDDFGRAGTAPGNPIFRNIATLPAALGYGGYGEGFAVTYVDDSGNPVRNNEDTSFLQFSNPNTPVVGNYEVETRRANFNPAGTDIHFRRQNDATRNTEGEIILRQNRITDFSNAAINLHDQRINTEAGPGTFVQVAAQSARYAFPNTDRDAATGLSFSNPNYLIPGVQIYNNLLINGSGFGIRFIEDQLNAQDNLPVPTGFHLILNNTIDGIAGDGIYMETRGGPTVLNNLITNNGRGIFVNDINVPPTNSGFGQAVVGYNQLSGNGQNLGGVFNGSNNLQGANPNYVDRAGGDYRILFGSPAEDAGLSDLADRLASARFPDEPTRVPNDDYRDYNRVDGPKGNIGSGQFPFYDVGAFEVNELSLRVIALSLFSSNGIVGGPISSFVIQFSGRVDPGTLNNNTVLITQGATVLPIASFTEGYDAVRNIHTFIVQMAAPLNAGSFSLLLDGTGTPNNALNPAIGDIAGQALDGEFNNLRFPSGNAVAGGDFRYNFTVLTSSIGDFVWNDINGDTVQNPGEPGLTGVRVNLLAAGVDGLFNTADDFAYPTQTTDNAGFFTFTPLPPGLYRVTVDSLSLPLFYALTTGNLPMVVTLAIGQNFTDADFGFWQDNRNGTVGDLIWDDLNGDGIRLPSEPGLVNVKVDLVGSGPDRVLGTADDVNFPPVFSDLQGVYNFNNLPAWRYLVTVDPSSLPAGYVLTTNNQPVGGLFIDLAPSQVYTLADFGYQQRNAQVGDLVWDDKNGNGIFEPLSEPPIPGALVNLVWAGPNGTFGDADDQFFGPQSTNINGAYSFTGLAKGNYRVSVDPGSPPLAGYIPTTPNPVNVTLTPGQSVTDADFGWLLDPQNSVIGDFVWNDIDGDGFQDGGAEVGLAGVTVFIDLDNSGTLNGGEPNATTNGVGAYSINSLPSGTYTVRLLTSTIPAGYASTTPNPRTVTLGVSQNRSDVDFGLQQRNASIGDFVFNDANNNTIFDGTDTGIGGVLMHLTWAGANGLFGDADDQNFPDTTTSVAGTYTFNGLPAGVYRVSCDPASASLAGLGPTTPNPLTVTISAGQPFTSADFGWVQANASIGNLVYQDLDNDGVQDGNETFGVGGITVFLDDGDGIKEVGEPTAVSNVNGIYAFNNLIAGTYNVRVDTTSLPAGYVLTTANPQVVTLTAGQVNNNVDWGIKLPAGSIAGVYYMSFLTNGTLAGSVGGGVQFTRNDIVKLVAQPNGSYTWSMYIDGSDIGLSGSSEVIDAFAFLADGSILISTSGSYTVASNYSAPGVGSGGNLSGGGNDLLRFTPAGVGDNTVGTWTLYFDGNDVGLSGASENIDAVAVLSDSRILISTSGSTSVTGGITSKHEDILAFLPTSTGTNTSGSWSLFFDGSDVGLGSTTSEGIDGMFVVETAGLPNIYLTTSSNFNVPGLTGTKDDIFQFTPTSLGSNTTGTYSGPTLDGAAVGIGALNLLGFRLGSAPGAFPLSAAGTGDDLEDANLGHVRWSGNTVNVYVDTTDMTAAMLGRIEASLRQLNTASVRVGGPRLVEVTDASQADIRVRNGDSTNIGGYDDGRLGAAEFQYDLGFGGNLANGSLYHDFLGHEVGITNEVILVEGWNWYTGARPHGIGAHQYDYQTAVTHELGHMLGLPDQDRVHTSAMFAELDAGETHRNLSAGDIRTLNLLYGDVPSQGQIRAAKRQLGLALGGLGEHGPKPAVHNNNRPMASTTGQLVMNDTDCTDTLFGGDNSDSDLVFVSSGDAAADVDSADAWMNM